MTEALQHWKKLAGKAADVALDERNAPNHGGSGLEVMLFSSLHYFIF